MPKTTTHKSPKFPAAKMLPPYTQPQIDALNREFVHLEEAIERAPNDKLVNRLGEVMTTLEQLRAFGRKEKPEEKKYDPSVA